MTVGSLWKKIISFAVPVILTNLLQFIFNTADVIVVGKFVGSTSLAAVGSTSSIVNLLITLFVSFSIGTNFMVADFYGNKDEKSINQTVHCSIAAGSIIGILAGFVCFIFSKPLLVITGSPEDVLPLATIYLKIYSAAIPALVLYNFCAAILRAIGDTRSPLIFMAISGTLNIILNIIFVTVFNLGVAGVALSTAITEYLSLILIIIHLCRLDNCCRLVFSQIRFYKDKLIKMLSIGFAAGIQGIIFNISNVMIQSSVNSFGSSAMAGNAAASSLENFVYVSQNSFYQAAITFSSQNLGAEKYNRIKKVFFICMTYSALIGISMCTCLYIFQIPLLSLYISNVDKAWNAVITTGILRVKLISRFQFIGGFMEVGCGSLRGLGKNWAPTIISLLGACVLRIVWIYTVFASQKTLACLYISYPISWFLTFLIHCSLLFYYYKKFPCQAD